MFPVETPELSEKTILITGATSGLGFEAARQLARYGARLVLACFEPGLADHVTNAILAETPSARITILLLDLADQASVYEFARKFEELGIPELDVMLLNAGISDTTKFVPSAQGVEMTFAVNHLGHWLLTGLLLKYIMHVPGSRIISVSSIAHFGPSEINYAVATGECPDDFPGNNMYAQSKLANHLFIAELNRRLMSAGSPTVAVPAHPGVAATRLLDVSDVTFVAWILLRVMRFVAHSPAQGALPLVLAIVDPAVDREYYYGPSRFWGIRGPPFRAAKKSAVVSDERRATELWQVSERLCRFEYSF